MTTQAIRFYHRGALVEVCAASPTHTVLEWLRVDAACPGTKEGCNEGDCGACTVVLAELCSQAPQGLSLYTVNACLLWLPMLDGKALFTVEDLRRLNAGLLHPVQQALVDEHGSQCGFCTPGFVMTLWAAYQRHQMAGTVPSREQWVDELAGNLCRCTGYRPIIDAAMRSWEAPHVSMDTAPVVQQLQALQRESAHESACRGDSTQRYDAPRTLDQLAALRRFRPQATLVAGATDVGLWVNKRFKTLSDVIYLGAVAELRKIDERANEWYIGAMATLESSWQVLAAAHPHLTEVWRRFASPPIRHAGTLGGNVINGSPIGDGPAVLMALDAELDLRCGEVCRRVPLSSFYVGYMQNQMQPGEFLQGLVIPKRTGAWQVRAYKISKRFDSDISALCAGLAIELDAQHRVRQVRLAFGGMAATVQRAARAEAALVGQVWSDTALKSAQHELSLDFVPLSDLRGTASYRMQVAQNLLRRFWLETRPVHPWPCEALRVWPQAVPGPA